MHDLQYIIHSITCTCLDRCPSQHCVIIKVFVITYIIFTLSNLHLTIKYPYNAIIKTQFNFISSLNIKHLVSIKLSVIPVKYDILHLNTLYTNTSFTRVKHFITRDTKVFFYHLSKRFVCNSL